MVTEDGDDSPRYAATLGPESAWETSAFSGSSVAPTEPDSYQDLNQVASGNSPMETETELNGDWCGGGGYWRPGFPGSIQCPH